MAAIRGSVIIERPIAQVFDIVADERNEPSYNPRLRRVEKLTDGPVGLGTRFAATFASGRRRRSEMVTELTAFERPTRIGSRTEVDGALITGTLSFAPTGRGTRMAWDWDVRLAGPARVLGPLVATIGARQERRIWTGLKHHLE